MDLSQYPTPETDKVWKWGNQFEPGTEVVTADEMRNMEQRLAACREFIRDAIDFNHLEHCHKDAAETVLRLTAPPQQ